MHVSNFQVFCFRFFKKPFICSLWYSLLVYTIWDPKETLPTVLGICFLVLSFVPKARIFLAAFSPIPCIATVVLVGNVLVHPYPTFIYIAAVIWLIIYAFAVLVWYRLVKQIYVVSPITGVLMYNMEYYISKGLRK